MAKQSVGIGSSANDGQGDTLRTGATKINDNFNEIYAEFGDGTNLSSGNTAGDILIADGTKFVNRTTSGDINISNTGAINLRSNELTIAEGSDPGSGNRDNKLYNVGGTLYWDGSTIGVASGGSFSSFTVSGDTGSDSVTDGNTLKIATGSGLTSTAADASGTPTVTINLDLTTGLTFEGATANDFETTLAVTDPTADRTITLPDATGTVALTSDITVTASSTTVFTNKTLTSAVLNTGVSGTAIKDEDNMSSDSATHLATQQSIKAYVDANALSLIDEDNMSTNSATRPPSQQSVKAYVDANAGGTLAGLSDTAISSSAAGQTLLYDGSNSYDNKQIKVMQDNSAFTTAFPTIDTSHIFRVTAVDTSGNAYYTFENFESSGANTNDPSLYLLCNHTYAFYLGWGSGHPFAIRTGGSASGAGTNLTASNGGDNLVHIATDGTVTTGTSANAKSSGWLIWQIPNFSAKQNASTGNYGYQCTSHAAMFGQIYIGRVQDLYGSW